MIKRNQQRCSFLLFFSITERNNEKFEIFHQNVWNIQNYSYLCSVKSLLFGYPGKFPERASRIRHYPFKDHHLVVFYYFLKLFIIIFRKPLLIAILRLLPNAWSKMLLPIRTTTVPWWQPMVSPSRPWPKASASKMKRGGNKEGARITADPFSQQSMNN